MTISNDTYRIGVGGDDITPPVGIHMAGFAARTEPSTAVYHPLKANAIAIDDGTMIRIASSSALRSWVSTNTPNRSGPE